MPAHFPVGVLFKVRGLPTMPFPGPETHPRATIGCADGGTILRRKKMRPGASKRALRHFNDLHEDSTTYMEARYFRSMFLAMKNTLAGRSPRRRMK
jgi:hypothetical protein